MKKNIPFILFMLLSLTVSAKQTIVTTASAINSGPWIAGDTIIMKNGTWTNQSISFKATGTALQPIVLMAETAGSVILTGTSKLAFAGKYITISGLYFFNGTLSGSDIISFRTSSSDLAENCTLTNTAIKDYNPSLNTVDSKWVSLYGKNNKVDHCSFENKNNSGTLMVVWLTSGVTPSHTISDNYFGYRNSNLDSTGAELNGQEIIRIGDSSTSMTTASTIVSGNYFEKCNGEIEVISNKSCGNLYTNNLFYECKGMLTLRHGNSCTVDGNYFFGNGITDTGGVRIIGENHKVYNNYFERLKGTNYRSAICIVRGKENSALNEYFQVKNASIEFNTMVNCSQSFSVNYNSSSSLLMPPIGTTVANNHVYNTTTNTNVNISTVSIATMDVTWKNNLMNMGGYTNFSYTASQIITGKDAKMVISSTTTNMYEPQSGSALLDYTNTDNSDVVYDIRGRNRDISKLPGASQISGTVSKFMPVKTEVGAQFLNTQTTAVKNISEYNGFTTKVSNKNILVSSIVNGQITVFDSTGKFRLQKTIGIGSTGFTLSNSGAYIIVFNAANGQQQSQKIIIN